MSRFIDKHTGIAKLRPKQGEKPKHPHKEVNNREIQLCLNCNKPDCTGNCKKVKVR